MSDFYTSNGLKQPSVADVLAAEKLTNQQKDVIREQTKIAMIAAACPVAIQGCTEAAKGVAMGYTINTANGEKYKASDFYADAFGSLIAMGYGKLFFDAAGHPLISIGGAMIELNKFMIDYFSGKAIKAVSESIEPSSKNVAIPNGNGAAK